MKTTRKIIFIMTDTQRWDMVGCYGNPDMKTPCLDRLAAEGMRFDRAYTCQPVCGPARSAIFTGTYPHTNGVMGNNVQMGDQVRTIGQRLQSHGFHTAYIGKWHLDGSDYFGLGRCPDGWDPDYWYDMRCYMEEMTDEERYWSRKPELMAQKPIPEDFTFGHRCSDRAVDFLSKYAQEDFFLTVSYDEPHGPHLCPEPYASLYRDYAFPKDENIWDTLEEKPEHQRVWAGDSLHGDKDALRIVHPYLLGCNAFVDHEIGRVLDAARQYAPDALIIYTSDHGDFLHSHSLSGKGPAMYDEICRIPFLVKWPGVVTAGSIAPHPVSHINIVPTILQAAGLNKPEPLEGDSLCPALAEPDQKVNDRIFMEFTRFEIDHDTLGGFQPVRAVFDGRYKLVINLMVTDEMYDLTTDPSEMHNLIEDETYAQIRDDLHDQLLDWMNRTRDIFRGYYWERRPWRSDARPATWEYTGRSRKRLTEEDQPEMLDYRTGLPYEGPIRPINPQDWKTE